MWITSCSLLFPLKPLLLTDAYIIMYSSVYITGSCSLQLFFNSCVICVYNTVYRTLVVFYCPVLMLLFFNTATCTCTILYWVFFGYSFCCLQACCTFFCFIYVHIFSAGPNWKLCGKPIHMQCTVYPSRRIIIQVRLRKEGGRVMGRGLGWRPTHPPSFPCFPPPFSAILFPFPCAACSTPATRELKPRKTIYL